MLNFSFSEKCLRLVSPSLFVYDFSQKMLHSKSQGKNLNILRTKRSFEVKCKSFFIIFQGPSVAKNYLRPESTYLSQDVSRSNEIP